MGTNTPQQKTGKLVAVNSGKITMLILPMLTSFIICYKVLRVATI